MMEEKQSHRMIVRFPLALHRRLKVLAALQNRHMREIVVEAVDAAVEIQEQETAQHGGNGGGDDHR